MGWGFQKPFLAYLSDSEKLVVNSEKENSANTAVDLTANLIQGQGSCLGYGLHAL